MGYLQFQYDGNNKTFLPIGTKVDYEVSTSNFIKIEDYIIKTESTSTVQQLVEATTPKTYKKDNKEYVETSTFEEGTVYYVEYGTIRKSCDACYGDGVVKYEKPGSTKTFSCPICNGKGYHIINNVGTEITGITFVQNFLTQGGYEVKYKLVPYNSTASIILDEEQVTRHG